MIGFPFTVELVPEISFIEVGVIVPTLDVDVEDFEPLVWNIICVIPLVFLGVIVDLKRFLFVNVDVHVNGI